VEEIGKHNRCGWWCVYVALWVAANGCDPDTPREDPRDASASESGACSQAVSAVASSLSRWQKLEAGRDSSYWYEEENCAPNNVVGGSVTTVEVSAGRANIADTREISRSDCQASVNRYDSFKAKTLDELYADCTALVRDKCDTNFETDDRGIVRRCTWDDDGDQCFDNCGLGFYLRRWDFGPRN